MSRKTPTRGSADRRRVFVLDRNPTFVSVLSSALVARGFSAWGGVSLAQAELALQEPIHAVVADLDMGIARVLPLLATAPRSTLRIVTTVLDASDVLKTRELADVDTVLQKPVELDDLCHVLLAPRRLDLTLPAAPRRNAASPIEQASYGFPLRTGS